MTDHTALIERPRTREESEVERWIVLSKNVIHETCYSEGGACGACYGHLRAALLSAALQLRDLRNQRRTSMSRPRRRSAALDAVKEKTSE